MRLVRHINDLPFSELNGGSVVTVGAYDGLHLGHEQLLERVNLASRELDLPSVVISFEPTPREFFAGPKPPARLMRFREKFDALAGHGIDIFYCPRFNAQMRDIAADAFIRRILVHGLNSRHIVVGKYQGAFYGPRCQHHLPGSHPVQSLARTTRIANPQVVSAPLSDGREC